MLWFRKTVYCLHTVYTEYTQMPQLSFIRCTVCHYMIYTYNTDSLLSLISVLIAKTTDYIPCFNPFNLNNKVSQFGFTDRKPIKSMSSIYIYKVVVSVCLFVLVFACLFVRSKLRSPRTNWPQMWTGELGRPTKIGMFLAWFCDAKLSGSTFVVQI